MVNVTYSFLNNLKKVNLIKRARIAGSFYLGFVNLVINKLNACGINKDAINNIIFLLRI